MMKLLAPDEIKRMAAIQGRHAEERAILLGQQENERRQLQAKQEEELLAERQRHDQVPLVPVDGSIRKARRPGGR